MQISALEDTDDDSALDTEADAQPDTVLESALTPDLPAEEELHEETQSGVLETGLLEEDPPSDELITTLEIDNQASVRNAVELQQI